MPIDNPVPPVTPPVTPAPPRRWLRGTLWVLGAGLVVGLAVLLFARGAALTLPGGLTLVRTGNDPVAAGVAAQTEQLFVENASKDSVLDSSVLDEWRAARGDHKIVAYAIANCRKIADFVTMPRHHFAALMLDLRPTGEHFFLTASASAGLPEQIARSVEPLTLSAHEQTTLLLSDAVARARVAAASGAAWNYPGVTQDGWYAVIVSALATLFITLKSAMSPAERDKPPPTWFKDPKWWRNFAFGAFGILAIVLSTCGTVLTSVKQFYDPTRAYLRNELALAKLRSLHQQVVLTFVAAEQPCTRGDGFQEKLPVWTALLTDMQKSLIKAAVPLPGDGDGSSNNGNGSPVPPAPPPASAPATRAGPEASAAATPR